MYFLFGSKPSAPLELVATFDSEQQLQAYVRWAMLSRAGSSYKFEQGSSLAGYQGWYSSNEPLSDTEVEGVEHNPSPHML